MSEMKIHLYKDKDQLIKRIEYLLDISRREFMINDRYWPEEGEWKLLPKNYPVVGIDLSTGWKAHTMYTISEIKMKSILGVNDND